MFDTFKNRLEITGILTTITALRISAGRSSEPIGSDLPVIKDAFGRPFIPGSSFKGAMRSRLESFLRGILGSDRTLVGDPSNNEQWSLTQQEISELKKLDFNNLVLLKKAKKRDEYKHLSFAKLYAQLFSESQNNNQSIQNLLTKEELETLKENDTIDSVFTEILTQHTDLISLLFGSPWIASKFQVRDLTVYKPEENWFGQYQERDGVAIDRDTETAADGKLYDYQVVPASTPFEFKAVVENAEEWELGLLMIGLHQFETEQIPLGGGRSRGLGVVKLEIEEMKWFDYPEDRPELLLEYLRKLVAEDDSAYEDASDFKDHWVQQLIEHLNQKISSSKSARVTN